MMATVREHHPNWHLITGKGPVAGFENPTLEVELSAGKTHWSLPVSFQLDGTEQDWHRIVFMKGWWMAQIWHHCAVLADGHRNRVMWLDADGRLTGKLDVELEPDAEVIASPWWTDPGTPEPEHHICSGMIIFQGARGGAVESILKRWAADCIAHIQLPLLPSPFVPGPQGDQCLLTKLVKSDLAAPDKCTLLKLDYDKYCGVPDYKTGAPKPGTLIDQWMMNEKMRLPEDRNRNWPPPEEARRRPSK